MNALRGMGSQSGRLLCVGVAVLHLLSTQATFMCALTPEKEVVVWLPNAVLLAALLLYEGPHRWGLALLTFASDVLGKLSVFPVGLAFSLAACNLFEVGLSYVLLQRAGVSTRLERIQDFGKFVVVGPFLGALCNSVVAGFGLSLQPGVTTPYLTLVQLWWYGNGLGLLIYTPMLLLLFKPTDEKPRTTWIDQVVLVLSILLGVLIFSGAGLARFGALLTPNLLLPSILWMAARFDRKWTSLAVAIISIATAWAQTTGHKPFGDENAHVEMLRTQEFILTLSIIGMGFAILISDQRALNNRLESKVRERTRELEEVNDKLSVLSITDSMTGLANRRHFDEVMQEEWLRAHRDQKPLAVALVDVDFFKLYNDHYGHPAGDVCLKRVAGVLMSWMRRPEDLVARYGGEEFALIAPGMNLDAALARAETMCNELQRQAHPHAASPFKVVTASIGVAVWQPGHDIELPQLIELADQALYQAKLHGRNRVQTLIVEVAWQGQQV
ncbi:diguanylate cyclase [Burkholderiaceae bacterium DAT-1]|nr:diguanylate cyclase [Burkholderiaceae bacterium DAT-1]